jgi:hypothetical protein
VDLWKAGRAIARDIKRLVSMMRVVWKDNGGRADCGERKGEDEVEKVDEVEVEALVTASKLAPVKPKAQGTSVLETQRSSTSQWFRQREPRGQGGYQVNFF